MAVWTVSNLHKKSCEEHIIWIKDNRSFKVIQGFRWGTWTIETTDDNPPEGLDATNPEGINLNDFFGDNAQNGAELISMDDGWYGDFEFDDDEFTEEEQEALRDLWDEDQYSSLEEAGWSNYDTEAWLFGPLQIVNEDTGEIISGETEIVSDEPWEEPAANEWNKVEITNELQDVFQQGLGNVSKKTGPMSAWPFPNNLDDDEEITFDQLAKLNPEDVNMKVSDKLSKVNESFSINMYDNGFMVEVSGRDYKDEWANAKILVASVEELLELVKETSQLPRD